MRKAHSTNVMELETHQPDASAANRALELLGREVSLFTEKKEVGKPGDFDQMTDEDLTELWHGVFLKRQGAGRCHTGSATRTPRMRSTMVHPSLLCRPRWARQHQEDEYAPTSKNSSGTRGSAAVPARQAVGLFMTPQQNCWRLAIPLQQRVSCAKG